MIVLLLPCGFHDIAKRQRAAGLRVTIKTLWREIAEERPAAIRFTADVCDKLNYKQWSPWHC